VTVALVLGLLVSVGGRGVPAAGQEPAALPATAALAPVGSAAFVAVDLGIENEQWAQAQELLARAGFPDALADLRAAILGQVGLGEREREAPADDPLFGGELGVIVPAAAVAAFAAGGVAAVTAGTGVTVAEAPAPAATPTVGGSAGVVFALRPGDPEAAFALAEGFLAGEEPVEYAGVAIARTLPMRDADGGVLARLDDTLLFAESAAELEPVIDAAQGTAPSLAGFGPAAEVRAELPADALLFAFLDNGVLDDAGQTPLLIDDEQLRAEVEAAQRSYTGAVLYADEPGFRFESIQIAAEGGSLAAVLPEEGAGIDADERVPADTFGFIAIENAAPEVLSAVFAPLVAALVTERAGSTDAAATPAAPFELGSPEEQRARLAEAEQILGFDLGTDLFDRLEGELAYAFDLPAVGAGGLELDTIVTSGVDDAERVGGSLARLARFVDTTAAVDVTTRAVGEDRVYVVRPDGPEAGASPLSVFPDVEFGVVGGELLIGVGDGIDEYVQGPGRSLAEDEQYRRVLALLPEEEPFQIVYVDLSQVVPFLADLSGVARRGSVVDADPDCADYDTQMVAQAAYDADPFANAALDQDFDGEACEDFFAGGTPAAAGVIGPEAVEALAYAAREEDGMIAASGILAIAGGEEE